MRRLLGILFLGAMFTRSLATLFEQPSYVALCLIAKDSKDLLEWVVHHKALGVDVFYVADNDSNPPMAGGIVDMLQSGVVQYLYLSSTYSDVKPDPQMFFYGKCMREKGHLHQWMGFFDEDEFIVTRGGSSVPQVLQRYEQYGGLTLNWRVFGSSGHLTRPTGGVLSNYHSCARHYHVKSFVQPSKTQSTRNPHVFNYLDGFHAVDTLGNVVDSPDNLGNATDGMPSKDLYSVMYLNHYILKSRAEFEEKVKRGGGDGNHRDMGLFDGVEALVANSEDGDCTV